MDIILIVRSCTTVLMAVNSRAMNNYPRTLCVPRSPAQALHKYPTIQRTLVDTTRRNACVLRATLLGAVTPVLCQGLIIASCIFLLGSQSLKALIPLPFSPF